MQNTPKTVPHHHEDKQWDGRFNVQNDEDLVRLLDGIKSEWERGKFKYILIGGVEIGTRSYQDDYQVKHVHVAAIFNNRASKRSILKNWNIKEGNGYYLVPRNRDLPYSGWRKHHTKEFSKIDESEKVLYEMGELPTDPKRQRVEESQEEKKLKIDEILIIMKQMLEGKEKLFSSALRLIKIISFLTDDKEDEAFNRFPKTYLQWGEKLKSTMKQRRITACNEGNPHLWVTGYPGTGKTAILAFIYPKMYKKNLYNKYFDLYDPKEHTHVMMEDLDHEAIQRLSINFIKTICDEAGFAIDQKYKTPQLARTTVLVSSNFTIRDLVQEGAGFDQNLTAICRRFWQIQIYELLRLLQLKLAPKKVLAELKREGNTDISRCFLDWDYLTDGPTGRPIKTPFDYQQIIRDYFYGVTG